MKKFIFALSLALVLASAGTAAVIVLTGGPSAYADGCGGSSC